MASSFTGPLLPRDLRPWRRGLAAPARLMTAPATLEILGWALVVLIALWWWASLEANRLVGGRHTWVGGYDVLGIDFLYNYYSTGFWLDGGNPYVELSGDPLERWFVYPPLVLHLFAWSVAFAPRTAHGLWMAMLGAVIVLGGWGAWRTRRELGLASVPLVLVVGVVLGSTPVIAALERSNCDALIVPCLLGAAVGLRRRDRRGEWLAGLCLAVAVSIKFYPGLVLVGLAVLGRWRVLAGGAVTLAGLVALHPLLTVDFLERLFQYQAYFPAATYGYGHGEHGLPAAWEMWWLDSVLGRVPGLAVSVAVALLLGCWVTVRLRAQPRWRALAFPYLLWMTALATFVPRTSNDYNLLFLPLAAVAVWQPRPPLDIQACLLCLFIWWQPFVLDVGPLVLFVAKLLGVVGVGALIVARSEALDWPGSAPRGGAVAVRPAVG